jgi:hypothetical protein
MKKKMYVAGYAILLISAISLQSCQDDPIAPNDPTDTSQDTVWVNNPGDSIHQTDSTWNGSVDPIDSTDWSDGGEVIDSTNWGSGNGEPVDSTIWNPNDSTGFGG